MSETYHRVDDRCSRSRPHASRSSAEEALYVLPHRRGEEERRGAGEASVEEEGVAAGVLLWGLPKETASIE